MGDDGSLRIVGAQLGNASREAGGFVAHRSAGTWQLQVLDTPDDLHSDLKSMAVTDRGAVVAGSVGFTAYAMRTCAPPDLALRIYRNVAGVLKERSAALGVTPIGDLDVTMAEVDGDGRRDLVRLSGSRLRVSRRTDAGFRPTYPAVVDKGVAVAAGDIDGDGRDDVCIVRDGRGGNLSDRLLVNDGNGLTDFLILNGAGTRPGPIQLLAAFEAEP